MSHYQEFCGIMEENATEKETNLCSYDSLGDPAASHATERYAAMGESDLALEEMLLAADVVVEPIQMSQIEELSAPVGASSVSNRDDHFAEFIAAGVLPYCRDDQGKIMFFLGKELSKSNTLSGRSKYIWSDFGGKREGFHETSAETACREFSEETLGLWGGMVRFC
jgi:hypothetical protein